jgi:hypothetical protein
MSRGEPEREPLERYAAGEIEVRPGRVNRWLLFVYAVLAVWGIWYLFACWKAS